MAFLHWPVSASSLREQIPAELELETFDGSAWIGVVPFRMSGVRLRRLPPLVRSFPELNVRTYVRAGDKPGVWFFSLDADNRLAVAVARVRYHLPYYHAAMSMTRTGREVRYTSKRTHRGAPAASFQACYEPTGPVATAADGSLEHFLVERYRLYTSHRKGVLHYADVEHRPWPLQSAEVELQENTMAEPLGIELEGAPLAHYAERLEVRTTALAPWK